MTELKCRGGLFQRAATKIIPRLVARPLGPGHKAGTGREGVRFRGDPLPGMSYEAVREWLFFPISASDSNYNPRNTLVYSCGYNFRLP